MLTKSWQWSNPGIALKISCLLLCEIPASVHFPRRLSLQSVGKCPVHTTKCEAEMYLCEPNPVALDVSLSAIEG